MDMTLRTLSPVHIGSGNNIEPFDYVARNGTYSRVNFEAFVERLFDLNPDHITRLSTWITETAERIDELDRQRKRDRDRGREFQNELNTVRRNFTLSHFAENQVQARDLSAGLMTDDDLAHYRCAINTDRQYQLKEQIKTANHELYIPGSSLKGALRTALAFAVLTEADERFKHRLRNRLAQYPDRARQLKARRELNRLETELGQEIEEAVFRCGSEIHFDLMRGLRVSDTFDTDAQLAVLLANTFLRQVDRNNRGQTPSLNAQAPVLLEALLPQSSFSVRLNVDLSFVRHAQPGAKEWIELDERFERLFGFSRAELQAMDNATASSRALERVLSACQMFSSEIIKEEVRWAEQFEQNDTRRILSFYNELRALSGCVPVRLGWGSHFMSTTVVLALRNDPILGEVMTDIVRAFEVDLTYNMKGKAGNPRTRTVRLETFPRSRRMAALRRSAGAPFGWVALSDPAVEPGVPLVDVDELTRLYGSPQSQRDRQSQGGSQRGDRYRGRQQPTSFEPRENTRSQGAMREALRGLQSLQGEKSQASIREGQRVNAEVISYDGRTVVVRLIDSQNEEVRFQQPAYPKRPGDRVKVKVQRVDNNTGRVTRVIPG